MPPQVVAIAVRQVDRLRIRPAAHTRPRSGEIFEPAEIGYALIDGDFGYAEILPFPEAIRGTSQNRVAEPARMVSGNGSADSWLKVLRRLQTVVAN